MANWQCLNRSRVSNRSRRFLLEVLRYIAKIMSRNVSETILQTCENISVCIIQNKGL